jgi:hypothetical protein
MRKTNNLCLFSKPIVVFVGNVGTGKTTHIYALSKVLNRLGYTTCITTLKTIFPFTWLVRSFTSCNTLLKIAVSLDLIFNAIRLPILALIKNMVFSYLQQCQIVLVEEYLPGSLADYIYNGIVYNVIPISLIMIRILLRLYKLLGLSNFIIVNLYCRKDILPKRWVQRGTPAEKKLYLIIQDLVFSKFIKKYGALKVNTEEDFIVNHRMLRDFVITMASMCNRL